MLFFWLWPIKTCHIFCTLYGELIQKIFCCCFLFVKLMPIFFPLYHQITCRRLLLNLLLFPNHSKNLSDLKNARGSSVECKDATVQDMLCFSSLYYRMGTFQPLFISSTGSFAAKQFHRFFLLLLSLTLFTSTKRAPSFQPTSQFIWLS